MVANALNMTVGSVMDLERPREGAPERYPVKLIGYTPDRSVLVSAPYRGESLLHVDTGDRFVARVVDGDSVYAFSTEVLAVCAVPYAYLHLRYPPGVQGTMLRRGYRVPTETPVLRLCMQDGGRDVEVTMVDVSPGGARLVATAPLGRVGEQFSIEMQPPGLASPVTLPCTVRHVGMRQGAGGSSYHHGVAFQEPDAEARRFLQRLIRDSITDRRALN